MTITTNHPDSTYGRPVILDDAGEPMDDTTGLKAVRQRLGLSTTELAAKIGRSRRTVEDYEQGRRGVPAEALLVLSAMLR